MKMFLDDKPVLKGLIDVLMIIVGLVSVLAGKNKEDEKTAVAKVYEVTEERDEANERAGEFEEQLDIVTNERDGAQQLAKGYKGQLDEAETELENFAERGKKDAGIIATLQTQQGEQGEQIGELTTALNSLRPGGPCDFVCLIDTTGSTDPFHDHVKESLKALFRWAPRLSSELRIGVIPFRDGPLPAYPLQVIHPRYKDGGRSQDRLLAFIDNLKTQGSPTHHLPVFREAFDMLGPARSQNRRAVAILVGDIGPSELDEYAGFSAAERREAERIVSGVRKWVSGGMRTVAAIYLGKGGEGSEDRQWFQSLSLPDPEHFASDSSQMFNVILSTIER
ncbi:vWA domain-containing protein [Rhodopirellula baltica]|uniref:VWFA domain-containing protein n=1 Tax=Rhodopirellula baltica SWK14 TaxID=993516 RepID=L7CL03_RHOBT|nr:vWA domain-containing protein [Rhodopirellula baltica]ELP34505.1 hypothetical protein RBSWK_01515 [Rhodopirellula baltica SWK14]